MFAASASTIEIIGDYSALRNHLDLPSTLVYRLSVPYPSTSSDSSTFASSSKQLFEFNFIRCGQRYVFLSALDQIRPILVASEAGLM